MLKQILNKKRGNRFELFCKKLTCDELEAGIIIEHDIVGEIRFKDTDIVLDGTNNIFNIKKEDGFGDLVRFQSNGITRASIDIDGDAVFEDVETFDCPSLNMLQSRVDQYPINLKDITADRVDDIIETDFDFVKLIDQDLHKTSSPQFFDLSTDNVSSLNDFKTAFDNSQYIRELTEFQIDQLKNIENTISVTQWSYLGELDQSLQKSSSPEFFDLTTDNVSSLNDFKTAFDNSQYIRELTEFQVDQLKNIENTISVTQWSYLGELDQSLKIDSDVEFRRVEVDIGPSRGLRLLSSGSNIDYIQSGGNSGNDNARLRISRFGTATEKISKFDIYSERTLYHGDLLSDQEIICDTMRFKENQENRFQMDDEFCELRLPATGVNEFSIYKTTTSESASNIINFQSNVGDTRNTVASVRNDGQFTCNELKIGDSTGVFKRTASAFVEFKSPATGNGNVLQIYRETSDSSALLLRAKSDFPDEDTAAFAVRASGDIEVRRAIRCGFLEAQNAISSETSFILGTKILEEENFDRILAINQDLGTSDSVQFNELSLPNADGSSNNLIIGGNENWISTLNGYLVLYPNRDNSSSESIFAVRSHNNGSGFRNELAINKNTRAVEVQNFSVETSSQTVSTSSSSLTIQLSDRYIVRRFVNVSSTSSITISIPGGLTNGQELIIDLRNNQSQNLNVQINDNQNENISEFSLSSSRRHLLNLVWLNTANVWRFKNNQVPITYGGTSNSEKNFPIGHTVVALTLTTSIQNNSSIEVFVEGNSNYSTLGVTSDRLEGEWRARGVFPISGSNNAVLAQRVN